MGKLNAKGLNVDEKNQALIEATEVFIHYTVIPYCAYTKYYKCLEHACREIHFKSTFIEPSKKLAKNKNFTM
jgi:hypothetical protein